MSGNRTSIRVRASKLAIAAVLAVAAIGVTATSASAASGGGGKQPGGVSTSACSYAGGGTWCAGTYYDFGRKHCYSNFTQPDWYHSSTAIIASNVSKGYANAGYFSYSDLDGGITYTCYTYWNNISREIMG